MKTTHIRPRLEDAILAYLTAQGAIDIPVYLTADVLARGEAAVPPFVSILCRSATPTIPEVGMEHVAAADRTIEIVISIITQANDVRDATSDAVEFSGRDYHNAMVAQVMDLLFCAEIKDGINQVADGVTIQNLDYGSESTEPTDNAYKTDIVLTTNAVGV